MNKKTKAALLLSVCGGFLFNVSPIYANEVNYQLTYKDEQSLVSVLKKEFSQDLGDLEIVKIEGEEITLESDDYRVVINALNFDEENIQEIEASLYEKNINAVLEEMGFPEYSIEVKNMNVVVDDVTPPSISVKDTYEISLGSTINWDEEVIAVDDKDGVIDFTVEDSTNYQKEGTYSATICAIDERGNEADKKVTIKVKDEEFYQKIADAALAQIGVNQDCTMLVTNSLAAVGINFHGAPYEYSCLGEWTNNPVPGDICIYDGHVALYIGNGQAVHGGWLGYTTIVSTVECTNTFIGYIHVNH